MNSGNLPIAFLACRVFQGWLEKYLPPELSGQVTFLDFGLHRVPKSLKEALQERIDQIPQSHLIVLGYGLCGNGLHGLRAGIHTLLVPRSDDCIAILLGSYAHYRQRFQTSPATYYLTKGWLEAGSNPLQEYQEYVQKYGAEKAMWLMDQQYQHYQKLAFVAHNEEDLQKYRPQALRVAEFCRRWGMEYEEILGSEAYLQRLVQTALNLDGVDPDFILVQPGEELSQSLFLRLE